MEGKKVADEVLRVAPLWAVSWLWGTRGRSPEYRDLGRGTVRYCGECGPPKWHLHEEHGPLPKTHSDRVCTPGFLSSYWALPFQQNVESLLGQYHHTLIILFRQVTSVCPAWPVSIHDGPLWANHPSVSLHPPAQIAQVKFSTLYCGRGSAYWQQKGIKGVLPSLLTHYCCDGSGTKPMRSQITWRNVARGSALTSSRKSQSLSSSPMTSTWWLMASMGKRSMGRGMEWLERSAAKGGHGGLHPWAGWHGSGLVSHHYLGPCPGQGQRWLYRNDWPGFFLGIGWINLLWHAGHDYLQRLIIILYSVTNSGFTVKERGWYPCTGEAVT